MYSTTRWRCSCGPSSGSSGPVGLGRSWRSARSSLLRQQGERGIPALVDDLVLEQAVVQHREPDAASVTCPTRRVDQPARDERRERHLVRAALGREAPRHDGERAFGVGVVDACRQREVRAEPMVVAAVVELWCGPAGTTHRCGAPARRSPLRQRSRRGGCTRTCRRSPVPATGRWSGRAAGPGPGRTRAARRPPTRAGRRPRPRSAVSSCRCRRRRHRRRAGRVPRRDRHRLRPTRCRRPGQPRPEPVRSRTDPSPPATVVRGRCR